MQIQLFGVPRFEFAVSVSQISMLMDLSQRHYDSVCKLASAPGGFLYGWKNRLEFHGGQDIRVSASWSELDVCLKIMEGRSFAREHIEAGDQLTHHFHRALDSARKASADWRLIIETGAAVSVR